MHSQTWGLIREAIGNPKASLFNLLFLARNMPKVDDPSVLRNFALSLPHDIRKNYAEECAFLETMSLDDLAVVMFPYPTKSPGLENIEIPSGVESGFPYVMHNHRSKLYFQRNTSISDMLSQYHILVDSEGLLGTGNLMKSPHCYQDEDFRVEKGDVLLDVGCAEAIFALDNIDIVSKAYLFESLPEWRKPLRRTFAPYGDKVVLVNKLVSDKTSARSTTLSDAVKTDMGKDAHFFVKMDIEGWERLVIEGNDDFFTSSKVKLSCCVYHRQDDAQIIEKMLKQRGYNTRFSDGWMLVCLNGIHYPYFRHGIIYAQNY